MKSTALFTALTLLVAAISAPVQAQQRDHRRDRAPVTDTRSANAPNPGMQTVSNAASPNERAYGWKYFYDPSTHQAIVISPQGDYYLSRGQGLRWVAGTQTGA